MPFRPLAIVALALAAGCLSPAVDDLPAPPQPGAVTADLSLAACREVGGGRFVSFEHAQALLPPGFQATDAAAFLGMPAPAGRAAVLSGHLACEGSTLDGTAVTWSDLIVPIEPPQVPGLELEEGLTDVYQLAQFASGAETVRLLRSVGFAAELAEVAVDADAASPLGSAATHVEGRTLLAFEVAGAVPQEFRLHTRFWQETPEGLAVIEHRRSPTTIRFGTLASCEAAAGSPFADAFGEESCAGADSLGGIFAEASDFESTLRFLPGVRPGNS